MICKNTLSRLFLVILFLAGNTICAQEKKNRKRDMSPERVAAAIMKVADWQLEHPHDTLLGDWVQGPFLNGLMALGQLPGGIKYVSAARAMGEKEQWGVITTDHRANDHCTPQTWIALYEIEGSPFMIEKIRKELDRNMDTVARQDDDMAFTRRNREKWSWCDALYMSPPAYAMMGKVTGKSRYYDFLHEWWWKASAFYYDETEHLYYRDQTFFEQREPNGKKVFWSRGNGWVMGGLVRVLQYLPDNDPYRNRYEKQLGEMAAKLRELQGKDGLWGSGLLDRRTHAQAETSGSAFFVYALAYAVNNSILPAEEYLPVIRKAWKGLEKYVKNDGRFTGIQPIGEAPVKYDDNYSMPYGVGAYLLAGTEVYKLFGGRMVRIAETYDYGAADRDYTIEVLRRIADPVLVALGENRLKESIPRRSWETRESNIDTSPLQAFGRTLSGMVPWLTLGIDDSEEGQLRKLYTDLAVKCIVNATDPNGPDYMFARPTQERIVHAAYLAYPLVMATEQLWDPLSSEQQENVIRALKSHRAFKPNESNWLLFSAVLEAALWKLTGTCEMAPVTYAVNKHMEWYKGDGVYGDGEKFQWDYYNSYVIHPLLLATLEVCREKKHELGALLEEEVRRATRYGLVLEHLISPEGTFPVIGRSSVYRFAAFQILGYVGFRYSLPEPLDPGATRAALTAVIRKMAEAPGTFDEDGWLNAGIVGKQENARDYYNYTGALYMCVTGLAHLGIPATDPFWTRKAGKWTQQRIWDGEEIPGQELFR